MCYPPVFPTVDDIDENEYCTAALSKLKGISFASLNIRSITRKYDDIRSILQRSKIKCLLLSETFLNGSITDEELKVPGYNLHRWDRNENSGKFGGEGL